MYDPVTSNSSLVRRVLCNRPLESNRTLERRARCTAARWWLLSLLASWAAFLAVVIGFYRFTHG